MVIATGQGWQRWRHGKGYELTPCHMIDTTDSGTHTTGCRTCSLVFNPSIFPLLHQWGSGICTQELTTMTVHIVLALQADMHKVVH